MKKIQYILLAMLAIVSASCMDGGYGEDTATAKDAFGNNNITETNVVTIKELCQMEKYKTVMTQYRDYKLVDDDIKLRLRVTGNDLGGNIYNKVALQDKNGDAILVCVYSGGMHSYLPVGQEIIIDLKGLYIGTYGYQHQIGVPYTTASGNTYPGRMANYLWQQHFKLVETTIDNSAIEPIEFTKAQLNDIDNNAGKLMTLKGVELQDADGSTVWAPSGNTVAEDELNTDFSIERIVKGYAKNKLIIYTSTSAKFAHEVMPKGKVNITGIFTRYNKVYQVQMRTLDDIKPAE